jgi:hypothetical protein
MKVTTLSFGEAQGAESPPRLIQPRVASLVPREAGVNRHPTNCGATSSCGEVTQIFNFQPPFRPRQSCPSP